MQEQGEKPVFFFFFANDADATGLKVAGIGKAKIRRMDQEFQEPTWLSNSQRAFSMLRYSFAN